MDKLQAMRFFLKLGETLSFKRTAQHFGVPPSKVSRSIKALESELDVRLVERTTRDRSRPLLQTENPARRVAELLAIRDPLYRQAADAVVQTDRRSARHVVREVQKRLEAL